MTNITAVKLVSIVLLTVILSPCPAASEDSRDRALDQYNKGLSAFEARNWNLASRYLSESFRYVPDSFTAFILSQTFYYQDNRPRASEYANKALKLSPPLPEEYVTRARTIISWARGEQTESRLSYSVINTRQQVFNRPRVPKGFRVDWCHFFGRECGEAAATAFCRMNGFQRAISFEIENDIGAASPTYVIGDDKLCTGQTCDGFRFIVCQK